MMASLLSQSPKTSSMPVATGLLQRCTATQECDDCREKRLGLQLRAANSASFSNVPPIVNETLHSAGQSLDMNTRTFMESRFGHSFANVRVHTDAQAAESARAVNALAYTVGRDVVFDAGQYAPSTNLGRRLIAHELTHVIQQRGIPSSATTISFEPSLEADAQHAAQTAVDQGEAVHVARTSVPVLSRQQPDEITIKTSEECADRTDITEQFSDFVRDIPALIASTPNLTAEQRNGLDSMADLVLHGEGAADIGKFNVVSCSSINLPLGVGGESFEAYVDPSKKEVGLTVPNAKLMDEYRLHKDKEVLTRLLQIIAHEKRHVTLGRSLKVEQSGLKPGRSISAAENAEYRTEEILTTAEEIAVGRMALGKDYEVPVETQEKIYRMRNMIRNWVTDEEYQRLRKVIIDKLRERYGFGDGCDTSLTLGVLTSMEQNKWHACNPSTGELYTRVPEGLVICDKPGHRVCNRKP